MLRFLRFGSLRQRLLGGFGLLVILFGASGFAARRAVGRISDVIGETLASVQVDAQLSSRLSSAVSQLLSAADRYIDSRDSTVAAEFRSSGASAHRVQREMNLHLGQSRREISLIATIDAQLSAIEVQYARAHRLADLGRHDHAVREANTARNGVVRLIEDVRMLDDLKARNVEAASTRLKRDAAQRTLWVLIIMAVAAALGLVIVITTVGWIARPMNRLTTQARALSSGDFSMQTNDELPYEFRELADMPARGD